MMPKRAGKTTAMVEAALAALDRGERAVIVVHDQNARTALLDLWPDLPPDAVITNFCGDRGHCTLPAGHGGDHVQDFALTHPPVRQFGPIAPDDE